MNGALAHFVHAIKVWANDWVSLVYKPCSTLYTGADLRAELSDSSSQEPAFSEKVAKKRYLAFQKTFYKFFFIKYFQNCQPEGRGGGGK